MQDTMNLLKKAICYESPSELPVYIGILPAARKHYGTELDRILHQYPDFFSQEESFQNVNMAITYYAGNHTDPWGCVWSNLQEGMEAYVTGHPVPKREDILTLKAPDTNMGLPHGFMYLRLLDLRGFEESMLDFAEECEELQRLIDIVRDYNMKQMQMKCADTNSWLITVGDDLGMQQGLAIGAEKWRKYLKPAFKAIYDIAHAANKMVYMHTDGDIIEIMHDLVETGVNMINPQYRANGIDKIVKTCKGKIPVMLDLDRQLFPFGSPKDMIDHVTEAVEKMYVPSGGFGLNLELGMEVPLENIDALIGAVNQLRFYKG